MSSEPHGQTCADSAARTSTSSPARVLAIAGCTNAGKTTMAKALCNTFSSDGSVVKLISQDDYFLDRTKVERRRSSNGKYMYYDYDSVKAIDTKGLCRKIRQLMYVVDFVVVEGNMLTEIEEFMELVDRVVFLTIDLSTCLRRRVARNYDPPDEPGYFDEVAWPAYQRHLMNALAIAREDSRMTFLDVTREVDVNEEEHMTMLIEALSADVVRITFDPLDVSEAMLLVSSRSCGGTSIFVGTTRDSFDGREVVRLEYESYDEMAYKEMRKLCQAIRVRYPSVERVVLFHRIGEVAVGEVSVIIATGSPHRTDAIRATEWAIDELKRTVPIWKKEAYADGGAAWKENADWMPRMTRSSASASPSPHAASAPLPLAPCPHSAGDQQLPLTPLSPGPAAAAASQPRADERAFAEASRERTSGRRDKPEGERITGKSVPAAEQAVLAAAEGASDASGRDLAMTSLSSNAKIAAVSRRGEAYARRGSSFFQ